MNEKNDFQKRIGVGEKSNAFSRHSGTSQQRKIMREDNGKLGGISTDHWDGSNDMTVFPETKQLRFDTKTGDVTPL